MVGCFSLQVFNEAVFHMFCSVLGRKLTSEEMFAVQALTRDPTINLSSTKNIEDTLSGMFLCVHACGRPLVSSRFRSK